MTVPDPLADSVRKLVDSTPVSRVTTGDRVVLEVTAYRDGHCGIAVGELGARMDAGEWRYRREASLPLNHRRELNATIASILDALFHDAGAVPPDQRRAP